MDESGDILRFGFRFLAISDEKEKIILEVCKELPFSERKPRHIPFRTHSFWLDEKTDYSCIKEAIEKANLKRENYDIFISLVTENDTKIVGVPDFVEKVAKMVDAPYVFSFTVIFED